MYSAPMLLAAFANIVSAIGSNPSGVDCNKVNGCGTCGDDQVCSPPRASAHYEAMLCDRAGDKDCATPRGECITVDKSNQAEVNSLLGCPDCPAGQACHPPPAIPGRDAIACAYPGDECNVPKPQCGPLGSPTRAPATAPAVSATPPNSLLTL